MSKRAHGHRAPASLDDRGASLVEYALLLALIALVCISALAFFGSSLKDNVDRSGQSIVSVGG
jgi:Flp pilus assembly pilin Flp